MRISRCTHVGQHQKYREGKYMVMFNGFDVTGNLVIVIECKIATFFKKIMVAGAHLRIIILLNRVKWGKMDLKCKKNIKVFS